VGLPSLPGVDQPPRQLKGFTRISVSAGKIGHASIVLDSRAFCYWDIATHDWKVALGDYSIDVGGSSREIQLTGHVRVQ
jgi:beta-glucosidase